MMRAYTRLAELGHAHSVEAWSNDELIGGLYGVAIGRIFYGEWLPNAQGEDVVAGIRTPLPINETGKNDRTRHLPSLEQPDEFNAALAQFLADV